MANPGRYSVRQWLVWAIALVAGSAIIAQVPRGSRGEAGPADAPPIVEFAHQNVDADGIVQTLNDLSKNGWEVFHLVPVWRLSNADGADTSLVPKSYDVFARRPTAR